MARKSGIGSLGLLLALIGGIILVIFGILIILNAILSSVQEIGNLLNQLDVVNLGISDSLDPIVKGIIVLIFGLIVIWSWREKKVNSGDSMLLWGILYIVFAIIAGLGLGGLLLLIGGILLIIDALT